MNNDAFKPVLLVDLKKNRIRIHKNTLRSIGEPEYVILLVNPETCSLAIIRSDHENLRAYHITEKSCEKKRSLDLYSQALVNNLRLIGNDWKDNCSYRFYGNVFPNDGMVLFHMAHAIPTGEN